VTAHSDVRTKRRDRLISVATGVFVAHGFRGVTMEAIAEAASISKATLYSYFSDKAAVFDAAAEAVAHNLVGIVEAELKSDLDPKDAVMAALTAKHVHIYGLVRQSQFSGDLFQAKDALSANHFDDADAVILEMLRTRLAPVCDDSLECAELLLATSQGIANVATSKDQLIERIARLSVLIGDGQ